MLNAAFDIIEEISSWNFTALIVGGAVRDLILGHTPKDIDISTNAPLHMIEARWPSHNIGKSKDFGIVTVSHKGFSFEVANFRTETISSNGRHPDAVMIAETFEEDSSRRDFSINSLGLDVNGNIIDFHNGREHLNTKVLRTVGSPSCRFEEDFLRIIRLVRFAARFGFHIECETETCAMNACHNLIKLSNERIHDELIKMAALGGKKFAHAIEIMFTLGILDVILPEVAALKNCPEQERFHPEAHAFGTGSSFDHTMQALRTSTSKNPIVNMGIVFHDLGKAVTKQLKKDRFVFYGHDIAGTHLIRTICKRLKFSNEEMETFIFCAENHMKLHNGSNMKPTKIVSLVSNKNWETLVEVCRADDSSRLHLWNSESFERTINTFEEVAAKWTSNSKPTKIVDGNLVMKITGLKPSKELGEVIARVTEMVMDEGRTENIEELIKEAFNER